MAGFHGLNIEQIRQRLEKKFAPAYKQAVKIAADLCADHLREKLSVPYTKTNKKGRKVSSASKPGQYPRKRSGSLQASVGVTKLVTHGNVYSRSFGIVKDVFLSQLKEKNDRAKKLRRTLFARHQEEQASYLRYGGRRVPGAFQGPKKPHPPTLYAKYLEAKNHIRGNRKLIKATWNEVLYSGKLKSALKQIKGTGSIVASRGVRPRAT